MKTFIKTFSILLCLSTIIWSCKPKDAAPEMLCMPTLNGNDFTTEKYVYDANGKLISLENDGIPFKFDYTGNNITKMTYSDATYNRVVTVEYDSQNRPAKAHKILSSKDFNLTADYVVVYDANGRLSTETVTFKGDFELLMVNRLEYDAKGNVLKHFIKENKNPEYLWVENSGFDDKKNIRRAVKLNPIHLFYEVTNLYDSQSENNQTVVKGRAKDTEYFGPVYNIDVKYVYSAYNSNGYPTAGTQDFVVEHTDFDDPTFTKTAKEVGSSKLKLDYLCK